MKGMMIRPKALAAKCFPNMFMLSAPPGRLMSRSSQRSMATAQPMVTKANRPTYLVEMSQDSANPVRISHFHHFLEKAWCRSL